ncbi:MAG TPA: NADP-dependent oxidoreductase [Chthonomonadaceae bacterium]|nr:NADP-dependent oxidoreductase [Chthonomonadaceae bacterium]
MSEQAPASTLNRRIVLHSRPIGEPKTSDFELQAAPIPALSDDEVLRRTIYLSLDPYMRGRMSAGPSYAASTELGAVMVGSTVSQVIASRNPHYEEGDFVLGYDGWQEYGLSDGKELRKLDPAQAPLSYALGVLGMPGLTAYAALLEIGRPQPGETVVVSAAAGAVGSVVGQIAKIKGCRAVGLAGTEEKCRLVTETLGFDACINYKEGDLAAALKATCPNGIDIYYDNTAGPILEAVLGQINLHARIPLVGLISQYNATTRPHGPNLLPLLIKRALIQGFLVSDWWHLHEAFLSEMGQWLREGKVRYKEDIVEGFESAPEAFLGLFSGRNVGKLLVRVSADPTLH